MKAFHKFAAQGEIQIRKLEHLPKDMTPYKAEGGKYVIGHSESGHVHLLSRTENVQAFQAKTAPEGMTVLYAILDAPNELVHNRDFDTHETIQLQPGIYEFRIGREFDPYAEMARKQAD